MLKECGHKGDAFNIEYVDRMGFRIELYPNELLELVQTFLDAEHTRMLLHGTFEGWKARTQDKLKAPVLVRQPAALGGLAALPASQEKLQALERVVSAYIVFLNSDIPLDQEFRNLKARIVTLACKLFEAAPDTVTDQVLARMRVSPYCPLCGSPAMFTPTPHAYEWVDSLVPVQCGGSCGWTGFSRRTVPQPKVIVAVDSPVRSSETDPTGDQEKANR